uniref:histidine kinase n=1 Tax=uncultured bacterium contig00038 TaxID=1181526 RepID=A0A806K142_9BACT|nr:signal transduction histidine kinase CheA [uncultured bacterium contig00038]
MSDFIQDDPSFYEDFLVEAQEHFEMIEQNFLTLESNPGDLEILNGIFRSVHTIKGASGFLGLDKIQSLAHIGENILDDLRKGRMQVTPEVMEGLFETVDVLKVLVNDVGIHLHGQGEQANPDTTDIKKRLEALHASGGTALAAAAAAAKPADSSKIEVVFPDYLQDLSEDAKSKIAAADIASIDGIMCLRAKLLPNIAGTPFNPTTMFSMVDLVGASVVSEKIPIAPEKREAWQTDQYAFDMVMAFKPSEPPEIIQRLFGGFKSAAIRYFHFKADGKAEELFSKTAPAAEAPVAAAAAVPPAAAAAAAAEPAKPPTPATPAALDPTKAPDHPAAKSADKAASDTIRVSQAKLDSFMNIVSELIMSKTMVNHVVDRFEAETHGDLIDELVRDLRRASVTLDQVSKELQASVLSIRMVPVKSVFSKFPRMLRDLAKGSGKKIELQMVGEETEIDKSLIEELGDPLIHLIRNSADHGIESPETRRNAGKSETGIVVLRARHEGDSVIVEIEDDGKGIDPVIIKQKAVEKGLLAQDRAEQLTNEDAINLIFAPGFSTAEKVTDISGRGVGMDVVRSNVRRLNGSVQVSSVVGRGSIFTLRLPLTLAIIDALLMKSNEQVFALPGTSVEETLQVSEADLSYLTRRKAINLRGEVLGVSFLSDLLTLRNLHPDDPPKTVEMMPVVVVSAGGRRMGLIVDQFVKRQEMVIKPLAPYLAGLPGISGASILGDGGVVLILDPAELITLATQEAS